MLYFLMNWVGIWFGAVVGLRNPVQIYVNIYWVSLFRQTVSCICTVILFTLTMFGRGADGYTTGIYPKSHRISDFLIYELPDRIGFSLRFFSLTKGTKGATKMKRLLTAGIFGTILGIVGTGTANASIVSSGFLDEKLTEMTNATTLQLDTKANQKDLTALNDIVGKENWHIVLNLKNKDFPHLSELFPDLAPDKGMSFTDIQSYIYDNLTYTGGPNLAGVTDKFLHGWTNSDGETYLGLKDINTKIGPLPVGLTVSQMLTSTWTTDGTTYPGLAVISDYIHRIELAYNTRFPYIFLDGGPSTTIDGVDYTGPVYPLWKLSEGIDKIASIEPKIGTLPTEIPNIDSTWERYGFAEMGTPIDLPDTIGGMFTMLFNEDGLYDGLSLRNIMTKILMGFSNSRNPNVRIEGLSSLTSAYNLVGDSPIVTAVKANTAKIGDLPIEYATVGAALTAIKGIAEDAKAAALAAIPDPKQEGSSGKFVLTVDIVGDNATYHWEKIDREGETTTTE